MIPHRRFTAPRPATRSDEALLSLNASLPKFDISHHSSNPLPRPLETAIFVSTVRSLRGLR